MINPNFTNIVIINGTGGSGKSTFCNLCKEVTQESEWYNQYKELLGCPFPTVVELSTIDYVKAIAKTTGWDGKKDDRGRAYLSALKDAMEAYDHIPSKKVMETIKKAWTVGIKMKYLFFVNIREPENINFFKSLCKVDGWSCSTLLITNPNVEIIRTNHADCDVLNYKYDYYITNDGTLEDLRDKAEEFLCYTMGYCPNWKKVKE